MDSQRNWLLLGLAVPFPGGDPPEEWVMVGCSMQESEPTVRLVEELVFVVGGAGGEPGPVWRGDHGRQCDQFGVLPCVLGKELMSFVVGG
jgi:hypothetical protein